MAFIRRLYILMVGMALTSLAACNPGHSDHDRDASDNPDAESGTPESYAVGGSVSGLLGHGLVLQNNGAEDLQIDADGAFQFATKLQDGEAFDLTVRDQPSGPSQVCTVMNGQGVIHHAPALGVHVQCASESYKVGGTVHGLRGTGLTLQLNGSQSLAVAADGSFSFETPLALGASYEVSVVNQPTGPNQVCSVTQGSGVVASADVTNVVIECSSSSFSVAGNVSGLLGTGLVLQNSQVEKLNVSEDGAFAFASAVPDGSTYDVRIAVQPSNPSQHCVVRRGSGTSASNVKDVAIECRLSLIFSGNEGKYGVEPYVTDGTEEGTKLLKDINPNTDGHPWYPTAADNAVYFVVQPSSDGSTDAPAGQLWKLTADALVRVNDTSKSPAVPISNPGQPFNMGGHAYFFAPNATGTIVLWRSNADGAQPINAVTASTQPIWLTVYGSVVLYGIGDALWWCDGTTSGRVKDASSNTLLTQPLYFTPLAGRLYLLASTPATGTELWVIADQTGKTAQLVKDFYPGSVGGLSQILAATTDSLYLRANNGTQGDELWRVTADNVPDAPLKDIHPSGNGNPQGVGVAGTTFYFSASYDGIHTQLWKTDGTATGTVAVKDVNPQGPQWFGPVGATAQGIVYFSAMTFDDADQELWRTDGTESGTYRLKDIVAGSGSSKPNNFVELNGALYFEATTPELGTEWWRSDGTEAGTVVLKDLLPGPDSGVTGSFAKIGSLLYFAGTDGIHGDDLWQTDGTTAGTKLSADLGTNIGSFPGRVLRFRGVSYFTAKDGLHGAQLWRSDGTTEGTSLVRGFNQEAGTGLSLLGRTGEYLFFWTTSNIAARNQLWRTDGTAEGTVLVRALKPVDNSAAAPPGVELNGYLYFNADDGVHGEELWRTDGTPDGTQLIYDVMPGTFGSLPRSLTGLGSYLYFFGLDNSNGWRLYKTDGTSTTRVGDPAPASISDFGSMTAANGALYGSATFTGLGKELWRSDGTAAGTTLVKDLFPGTGSSSPTGFLGVGSSMYFFASPNLSAVQQLWKTDGTAEGTVQISTTGATVPRVALGNLLLFAGYNSTTGTELWRSDGTSTGTALVMDIGQGSASGLSSSNFMYARRVAVFDASTSAAGHELWVTDGTAEGTKLIKDLRPGSFHGFISMME